MSLSGVIVMWQVLDMPYSAMKEAWEKAGYPVNKIPAPNPSQALYRALVEYTTQNPELLARSRDDGTQILFIEDSTTDRMFPIIRFSIRDSVGGRWELVKKIVDIPNKKLKKKLKEDVDQITESFTKQLDQVGAMDVSALLTDVAVTVAHGAKLRNGVYFIPSAYVETWRDICKTVQKVAGHEFYEIPIEPSDVGDRMIASSVIQHLEGAISNVDLVVDTREKAHKTILEKAKDLFRLSMKEEKREQRREAFLAGEIEKQLGVYEELFSGDAEIADRLSAFRARLSAVFLKADEEEESV